MSVAPRVIDVPAETLRLAVGTATDAAGREENQDVAAALVLAGAGADAQDFLLVVADGMGGHAAGDVASRLALDSLTEALPTLPEGDVGQALKQAYRQANDAIYAAAAADSTRAGMGTTLTSAVLHGKYATVAHVGDSRVYLLRGNGITQVTHDHTVVADEVAQGRLNDNAAKIDPRRHRLTHAVGTHQRLDRSLPSIFELTLLPDDRLMLCTDGLYDVLDGADIRRVLRDTDPGDAAMALVALAKERGTHDNATAVVAAAIPTRVPVVGTTPSTTGRTGGVPGMAIAAVIAILLIVMLVLALFVLGTPR